VDKRCVMKIFDHEDQIGITLMMDFEMPRIHLT